MSIAWGHCYYCLSNSDPFLPLHTSQFAKSWGSETGSDLGKVAQLVRAIARSQMGPLTPTHREDKKRGSHPLTPDSCT